MFGFLLTVVFLLGLSRVVFAPLVQSLMDEFTVSEGTIGLVLTLMWGGTAVGAVPAGYLLTRVDRRPMIVACGAVLGGANVLVSVAPTVELLALGAALLGLTAGGYFAAVNPFLADLYPTQVGQAVGIHGMSHQVAATLAPVAVTAALVVGTWRTIFAMAGAVVFVATALFWTLSRDVDSPGRTDAPPAAFLKSIRSQWRVVVAGVGMAGATMFVWMGVFNFYVPYLSATKTLSSSSASLLLSLSFAAGIPAFWVSGRLADRIHRVPLVLGIVAAFAGLVGLLPVVDGFWPLAAVSIALGFVIHALFPALDAYLLTAVSEENRGSLYGLMLAATITIEAPGSAVLGALVAGGVAYDVVFRLASVGLWAVLACLLIVYRLRWIPE
ncbi:MAG: MFS transporter [Natronomonas sp.]|uniref:MFS transporter n=1 Tax=Natronomonas sp. TaxID=2184060 RepID=UPI00287063E4|nr:MFS transporter [Natronomonas sp.]MDR9430594.1 MFS transporter [Natronomonas sp.]